MVKKIDPKVKLLSQKERLELLTGEMALLNKKHGKEIIAFGVNKKVDRLAFNSKQLNDITGGGLGKGRFNIIWGPKGTAKTTTAYEEVANIQKEGGIAYWVDLERSFDPIYATKCGINVDTLMLGKYFNTAEDVMDSIIKFTKLKAVDIIVIDSIQGMSPTGEHETKKGKEKSLVDDTMALLAKKLSQFLRMSASGVAESNCTILMIGQTRTEIGGHITFDKLSGGHAIEHWSSLTLRFTRGAKANSPAISDKTGNRVKANNEHAKTIGFEMVVRVDKTKMGPDEGKETRLDFIFGDGIRDKIAVS